MSISEANQKKYCLIERGIIQNNYKFSFDLYTQNGNQTYKLVYKKNTQLNGERLNTLVSIDELYIDKREQVHYEKCYKDYLEKKELSDAISVIYDNIKRSLEKLFEDPDSLENLQEANENISTMVKVFLHEKFTIALVLLTLTDEYYTHTHSLNVSIYALCLGKYLDMNKSELEDLGFAALLHDIGKSRINQNIIEKQGELTREEFEIVKKHSEYSWEILKQAGITNRHILEGVRNHHEKIDGTGYPDQLKDEDIHEYAKIIGLCDVFDALSTKKSYKDSMDTFNTLVMMKKEMKNHLDGRLVNKFILMFKEGMA
jgi:HD-GYP domain-containing protein (c-di-GMP phosphodiesterase class II)